MRWMSGALGVCVGVSLAAAQEPPRRYGGLPLPDGWDARAARDPSLQSLARRWAPDIYQDVDDTHTEADLITAMDFDGDVDMTNNWESLEGRSIDSLLEDPSVYWWGSQTDTHVYLGYAWFHPRDWHDEGSLQRFGRNLIGKGTGEHENDLEGILLVIDKATGEPVLMVTQAHNDFWQYGDASDFGDRDGRDDLDGPIRRDPVTGRVQVFVEAKGHGVYGSPSKTDFDAEGGDGVLYSAGGSRPAARDGLTVTGYGLESITPWYERFRELAPGEENETFSRAGSRPAFTGDTRDANSANPPWAWSDGDYPDGISGLFWSQPAVFVNWMLEPKGEFDLALRDRTWKPLRPAGAAGPRPRSQPAETCGAAGRLNRLR